MMHMDPPRVDMRDAATLAATAIAEKDGLPMTAEAALGIPETNLADPAQVGTGYFGGAARAEEAALDCHARLS